MSAHALRDMVQSRIVLDKQHRYGVLPSGAQKYLQELRLVGPVFTKPAGPLSTNSDEGAREASGSEMVDSDEEADDVELEGSEPEGELDGEQDVTRNHRCLIGYEVYREGVITVHVGEYFPY